jgi:hypothetical protein
LLNAESLRGSGDVSLVGDRDEVPEVPQLHAPYFAGMKIDCIMS